MENYILSLLIFIPIFGALVMLPICKYFGSSNAKVVALITTAVQFLLSFWLYCNFDSSVSIVNSPFTINIEWIKHFNIYYYIGVDGLSMPMVFLTSLLSFLCILASWNIEKRPLGYFALFLLLDTGMMGVFLSLDFFLFYIFWEVMLLPMYFLIGMWGGPQRHYAAIKFFLYTLFGSVFMLLAMLALYYFTTPNTFSLTTLIIEAPKIDASLWGFDIRYLIWISLFIGFAIKVPIFPFHTWLPLAHVEAPTAVSVILAGVLLKMGTYGLLRISYPLLPFEAINFAYTLAILGVINIIWGAVNAIAQIDLKKMVAYSSVSHMGYVLLGMASIISTSTAGVQAGLNGAIMQMFNHGIITAMLFLLVGILYDQAHHRWIVYPDNYKDQEVAGKLAFGGLASQMPIFNAFIIIAFFAGLGLPALSGFISEALCFIGGFSAFRTITIIGTLGILLNAVYFLRAYQRMFTGPLNKKYNSLKDISKRELCTILPLTFFVFLFGVYPKPLINMIKYSVENIITIFQGVM